MNYQGELVVRDLISRSLNDLNISVPAVVVGVERLSDGFVDVKPIVNYMNSLTRETVEYPVLRDVPVIFPSTKNTTICFPIAQGDFVSLLFQSNYVRDFSLGNTEVQDPPYPNLGDLSQVVAITGFNPYQMSCLNPNNYRQEFDNQDLNIVHNKDSNQEVSITLDKEGGITLRSQSDITVEATNVNVTRGIINVAEDLLIKGLSVFSFMTKHTHIDSKGGNTSPPIS